MQSKMLWLSLGCCFMAGAGAAQTPVSEAANSSSFSRLTHTHSIFPPKGQLKPQLPALIDAAKAGNRRAAATIYSGLVTCQGLKGYDEARFNAQCQDITNIDLAQSSYWLQQAAAAGDIDAQYDFANGIENATGIAYSIAIHEPAVRSFYVQTSRKYLDSLARACNADAIGTIVRDARRGSLIYGNDPATAYKYAIIYNALQPAPHFQFDEQSLATQLTSAQPQELRKQAQAFLEAHCR